MSHSSPETQDALVKARAEFHNTIVGALQKQHQERDNFLHRILSSEELLADLGISAENVTPEQFASKACDFAEALATETARRDCAQLISELDRTKLQVTHGLRVVNERLNPKPSLSVVAGDAAPG
jgi:hypothetical protein